MNTLPLLPCYIHSMLQNESDVMMYILRTQIAREAYPQIQRMEFFD
jgi:hypothetical protein